VAFVKSGKLSGLMVTDSKRWVVVPDVPDANEAGLPQVQVITWNGVLAPAGMPIALVERLHQAIVGIMNAAEMKKRMAAIASEATTTTPEQFADLLRKDFSKWLKLIKETGARAE
jgi:tripartite-type tricarboxylate transporter receptor subunit TctC